MERNQHKPNQEGVIRVTTTVQKWGNSLAVRIPKDVAERVSIHQGSVLDLSVDDQIIQLVPKKQQKKYSLEELLAQCTPDKAHEEIDFGIEGNELI